LTTCSICLHGAGERGTDVEQVKAHGIPRVLERGDELPCIVVSPQCPPESRWVFHADLLRELVYFLADAYPVDPSRIYLTGLSMGGFGSWELVRRNPELFAAVVPVCGGTSTDEPAFSKDLRAIVDVPIWIFHGAEDETVVVQRSDEIYEPLKQLGGNVRYTRYEGVPHDSWTQTYDNPALYDWLLSQRRGEGSS
jgi:predicted peptidase